MPRAIKTHLVGGFLGAGKTTFILERLRREGGRTAVLVNEFGALGIDGELIRARGGLDVVEMPGGCICCSQKEGLVQTIRRIAEKIAPERLLIEPSGVAETSELLHVLADRTLAGVIRLDGVITVVDAESFLEFSEPEGFGLFFLDQVQNADLIVVNKADQVDDETLDAVEQRLARLAPAASTVRTSFCRLDLALPEALRREPSRPHHHSPDFDTLSVVPPAPMSKESLDSFLAELESGTFGRIIRGKGFFAVAGRGTVNVQIASGRTAVEALGSPASPRLTLIGVDLLPERLALWFDSLPES